MMLRGFKLPSDLAMIGHILLRVLFFRQIVVKQQQPPERIIRQIRYKSGLTVKKSEQVSPGEQEIFLTKVYRTSSFWLIRVMHQKRPCLIRTYVVMEMALRQGFEVQAFIGAIPQAGDLAGHAWVELNGLPLLEDPDILKQYTVMIKA